MLCIDANPKAWVSIEHGREQVQDAACHKNVKFLELFRPGDHRFGIFHTTAYLPTISGGNGEIAASTSPFSLSGA